MFRSVCVKKIFTSKKLWIKMCKNFVRIFSSIFGSRRASAPFEPQNWKWNHEDNHTSSTYTDFTVLEENSGQDPLKLRKIAISQNWHQNQKKVYHTFIIIYLSWKFHENRPNRFTEIFCRKSERNKNNKNIEKETIE